MVTSPPKKVEIRAGTGLVIPLGPTKREGEKVKVDLGHASSFMRFTEDSELIIDGNLLTNDKKGLYRVTVTVSESEDDIDDEGQGILQ